MPPSAIQRQPQSPFFALPYDIRHLIYAHLFPDTAQLYIQVQGDHLQLILPDFSIPIHTLLISRQFHEEAGGYLYNNYLFNLVGTKSDCLAGYRPFLRTLRKHARKEVNINAFSNGEHSSTMCLSLQAGEAKMEVLNRRRRGQPKTIRELQHEQFMLQKATPALGTTHRTTTALLAVFAIFGLLVALLLAYLRQ